MQQTGDAQLLDIADRFDAVRVDSLAPVIAALSRAGVLVRAPSAVIMPFMQQTGDAQLLDIADRFDAVRVDSLAPVIAALSRAGVLRPGLTPKEAADLIWCLTGPDWYGLLVRRREWDMDRWEESLGDILVRLLLACTGHSFSAICRQQGERAALQRWDVAECAFVERHQPVGLEAL